MTCKYCKPDANKVIKVDKDQRCTYCGEYVSTFLSEFLGSTVSATGDRWDSYFHKICTAVSSKSPCLSRNIGAIIVRDKSVISTGYNGPPRNYPHCEPIDGKCPRHAKGYKSG